MIKRNRGCYRCQSRCDERGCRVCRGKVLCQDCQPEYGKRDYPGH